MKGQIADKLNTEERCELKDEDFGIPETREFPMPDAPHVRAAEAYFRYAPEDKKEELAGISCRLFFLALSGNKKAESEDSAS